MDKFVILAVLLVAVIIILLWLFWDSEKEVNEDENKEAKIDKAFYNRVVKVIDALQTKECEGLEKVLGEIIGRDSEKKEFYVIFGNVLREKGYINKAIEQHKLVLHRRDISKEFKAWALASLAEDFRMAGMIERALRTYKDAFNLNPKDKVTLKRYIHLCKQTGEYEMLLSLMNVLGRLEGISDSESYREEVAFIYNELGEENLLKGDVDKAILNFKKAIQISSKIYPSYINLAKIAIEIKNNKKEAISNLQSLFSYVPDKAFLGLPIYKRTSKDDFENTCLGLIAKNEDDWRTRLELGKFYAENKEVEKAFDIFMEAMKLVPHVLLIHQEVWKLLMKYSDKREFLVDYAKATDRILIFNAPFVCVDCKYKSSEILWKCPSCYSFNSFIEARI
jgi:lipopolysaccharide biosynthesis regulator YciM